MERSVVNGRFRCYAKGNLAETARIPFVPGESPNARPRSHLKSARSVVKPAGTRREPVVAVGTWSARLACDGGGGVVVGTTERSPLPAVGNSGRAFLARHLIRHLCLRAEARGFGTQADSEGLSESDGSHTFGGATGSVGSVDHAFAAQLQRADRFPR